MCVCVKGVGFVCCACVCVSACVCGCVKPAGINTSSEQPLSVKSISTTKTGALGNECATSHPPGAKWFLLLPPQCSQWPLMPLDGVAVAGGRWEPPPTCLDMKNITSIPFTFALDNIVPFSAVFLFMYICTIKGKIEGAYTISS